MKAVTASIQRLSLSNPPRWPFPFCQHRPGARSCPVDRVDDLERKIKGKAPATTSPNYSHRMIPLIKPDGRQSPTAAAIQKGVCRHLRAAGFATLTEFTLASGRRVDILGLSPSGQLWIVEIKSSPADFPAGPKWPEYPGFSDALSFAIPHE